MRRRLITLRRLTALRRSSSSLLELEVDVEELEAPAGSEGEEVGLDSVELSRGLGERGLGMGSSQNSLESESSFTKKPD